MRNVCLIVEYDGTAYNGWQSQRSAFGVRTVQETIEGAIEKVAGARPALLAAGRTDSGVHALGQVASFKTETRLDSATIKKALNAGLPDDIRIVTATDAPDEFHPRFDAKGKKYVYLIFLGETPSVFLRRYVWDIKAKLDVEAMQKAALHLIGNHDFKSFQGAGCSAKTTERTITSLAITETESIGFLGFDFKGRFLRIEVQADAFLRHMVRNIVGTLVAVGKGRTRHDDLPAILNAKDRRVAGRTAPARGLFLEEVRY